MNRLCQQCLMGCKQPDATRVVDCRKYRPAPVQMVIKFKNENTCGRRRGKRPTGK